MKVVWFLSAIFSCDEASGKVMAELLARETRPDFPEDIPAGWEEFYDCLELWNYPANTIVRNKWFYMEWGDGEIQPKDLLRLVKHSPDNNRLKVVYYVPDDPMSSDEDEEELLGCVLVMRDDLLEEVPMQQVEKYLACQQLAVITEANAEEQLFVLAESL